MRLLHQFLRFAAVGATGTLIQYLVLWGATSALGLPAALASGIGYALGSIMNYILNYFFTFESGKSHFEAASKYYAILGIGWCVNTGLMALLVHHLKMNIWLAQLFTSGVGLVWNFTGSRFWAFRSVAA
jgi:putative flippase GtrA